MDGRARIVVLIVVLAAIVSAVSLLLPNAKHSFGTVEVKADVEYLKQNAQTFTDITNFLERVATEKSALYAFEVLRQSELPANTDYHLLGHVVGDELYKQHGVDGMALCTHEFRNACSHAIVIGALHEYGEGVIPQVHKACSEAPGGSGAYTMCFHGFGHGVLAFNGYDLEDTTAFCKQTGTEAYNNREYIECVGGAIMEILGGGGHDQELWLEKRAEYLSFEDPLSLCRKPFIEEELRPICYIYLTPHLFESAGGNLAAPTEADFSAAFRNCESISVHEDHSRRACFGGLGKEFVALAQSRDIRDFASMTPTQFRQVYEWCELAEVEDGVRACMLEALNSFYWGGEVDRSISIRYCSAIPHQEHQDLCFEGLVSLVDNFINDEDYRNAFCVEIPSVHQSMCTDTLLNQHE